jgi:hypothetical protein
METRTGRVTLQDARRRRLVRVVGYATGELVWVNESATRAKVRITDINGHHRHWRGPIDQVTPITETS